MRWDDGALEPSALEGLTFSNIKGMEGGSEKVVFTTFDNRVFVMEHYQDCCEHVELIDVIGDPQDLVGTPIVKAYKETSDDKSIPAPRAEDRCSYEDDAEQWTFYRFSTIKGTVTLRWFGSSNGYYSVGVDLYEEVRQDETGN